MSEEKLEKKQTKRPEKKMMVEMSCNWYSGGKLYKAGEKVSVSEELAEKMKKLHVIK